MIHPGLPTLPGLHDLTPGRAWASPEPRCARSQSYGPCTRDGIRGACRHSVRRKMLALKTGGSQRREWGKGARRTRKSVWLRGWNLGETSGGAKGVGSSFQQTFPGLWRDHRCCSLGFHELHSS
ncbi:Hypothetical predicted protein [Marmota monax]|uniref:Uncharacterized protein n=1 Tax=Marmota monax TaxID=9995 RepID=A0A5E4D3F5_MARMO|nr:hypothetical protein GHT09_007850 [Marmota monax]VTJ87579.1 Hypothetical predicted protein [Marmota monax]